MFVLPCLPFAALALPLVVTLPEFYASHVGLDLALVGMVFLLARLFDIATDPIVGIAMDRTRTRFGRFRLWLALSLIPLMGAVYMVFFADPGSSMARLVFWLFALYAIFSVSSLSHMSWGAALSPDYHQRSRVFAWWQGANILGMVIALLIPPFVMQTGLGTYVDGVRYMALFILALLPITVGLCVLNTRETIAEAPKTPLKISDYLKLYRRPDVVRILLSDLLLGIAPGITAAMFFFFFEQIKGLDRAQTSIVLLVYFIAGLIGAPIWVMLSRKIGKHRALALASLAFAALYVVLALVPRGNFPLILAATFVTGLPYAASMLLLRAMMSDISDEVRLEVGKDLTGQLFSILNATVKTGQALAVGVLVLVGAVGFDAKPGAYNAPETLDAVLLIFVLIPGALFVLAAFILNGYSLTETRHAEIRRALEERNDAPGTGGFAPH